MRPLLGLVAVATLAAACGKPNLGASCRRLAATSCKRAFECSRASAERLYGDEGTCTTQQNNVCAAFDDYECDDLSAYDRCVDDFAKVSCAATIGYSCPTSSLSTCRPRSSGGRTACTSTNINSQSSACTVTLSNCTDGRAYVLSCSGNTCSCNDGSSTRSVTSSCSTREAAIAVCGWNVQ